MLIFFNNHLFRGFHSSKIKLARTPTETLAGSVNALRGGAANADINISMEGNDVL